jgi:hypothetical protein
LLERRHDPTDAVVDRKHHLGAAADRLLARPAVELVLAEQLDDLVGVLDGQRALQRRLADEIRG